MPTTPFLDDLKAISELDSQQLLAGAESLTDQIRHGWEQTAGFSADLKPFTRITFAAMGGSHLGVDIIRAALADKLNYPIEISSDYTPAKHVDDQTLVIAMSFSGGTEETVTYVQQAAWQGAQILVLAGGGELISLAEKNSWPHLVFDASENASKASRMGIGYALALPLGVLKAIDAIEITDQEVSDLQNALLAADSNYELSVPTNQNPAKALAFSAFGRRPVFVSAQHLAGSCRAGVNQFHENAKLFASQVQLPEANHHLLEGLGYPDSNKHDHLFIFFESELYHQRNIRRFEVTQKMFSESLELEILSIKVVGETALNQAAALLSLLVFASVYTSFLEKIDGGPLPQVDSFKSQL